LAHPPVRFLDELGDEVPVARGHRRRGPAEHAHDDALVDALDEEEGRGSVARVVQPGGSDAGALQERGPVQRVVAACDGPAGYRGEDHAAVGPNRPCVDARRAPALSVLAQCGDQRGRQRQGPA